MFSSRLHGDLRPTPLTAALQEKRARGVPLLDLTESNPTHAGLAYPPDLLEAFTDPRALRYDASPIGDARAREAIAAYYAERGHRVPIERILLTASTSEAYAYLFKLLADPGDEALVPRPSYPLFEFLAGLEAVRVRSYPLRYHEGWFLDRDALAGAITPRTRAIVIVNPNNPTGSYLKRDELAFLTELCRRHQLALISDEVFADYSFEADPQRVDTLVGESGALSFSLSGLSKVAGLPQMKLGWIVCNGPEDLRRQAWERLEFIADTYLSVSTPVQSAAPGLLGTYVAFQRELGGRLRRNWTMLREAVGAASPFRLLHVEGGWYATLQAPRIRTEEEWVLRLLNEQDVLAQPGYFYDFESEAFLILSLLTPEETFREGVRRLLAI